MTQSMNTEAANREEWQRKRCSFWPQVCRNNVNSCQWTWAVLLFVSFLLLVILLPLSYSYVEYDEWALKRDKYENTVELDQAYDVGRYYWGLSNEPLTFSRKFVRVEEDFAIFPSNGLEFDVSVVFFYRIQKDNLGKIYQNFGTTIHNQVVNRANARIKNIAPNFSLEQYITHRPLISRELHLGLVDELSSIWVDVPADKFYLYEVKIPSEIRERDLDAAVQKQRNLEEQNRQLVVIVQKETEKMEEEINANVTLIGQLADATADRMRREAEAIADKTISSADGLGLQNLFLQLNVSDDADVKDKYISYFAFVDSMRD